MGSFRKVPERYCNKPRTPKDNPINERFNRTLRDEFIDLGNFTPSVVLFNKRLTKRLTEYDFVSIITELELFGFANLISADAKHIEKNLETVTVIPADSRISRMAGAIRSRFGLQEYS